MQTLMLIDLAATILGMHMNIKQCKIRSLNPLYCKFYTIHAGTCTQEVYGLCGGLSTHCSLWHTQTINFHTTGSRISNGSERALLWYLGTRQVGCIKSARARGKGGGGGGGGCTGGRRPPPPPPTHTHTHTLGYNTQGCINVHYCLCFYI